MALDNLLNDPNFIKKVEEIATKRINIMLLMQHDMNMEYEARQYPNKILRNIIILSTLGIWIYHIVINCPNICK